MADVAASITGIAGPSGGTAEKPVGLVFVGIASRAAETSVSRLEFGDIGRQSVRLASVREALKLLEEVCALTTGALSQPFNANRLPRGNRSWVG